VPGDEDESLKLHLGTVLWRTRGLQWDYLFVLRPPRPLVDSWYDVHVKVFEKISPASAPVNFGGVLVDGSEKYPFVATAFQDAVRKDAWGRPVANYLIWFPNLDLNEVPGLNVPLAWGEQVVSSLGEARDKTFDFASSEEHLEEVFATARDCSKPIVLDSAGVWVDFDRSVVVEKKKAWRPTRAGPNRQNLLGVAILFLLLLTLFWYASR
jgi:hypothetical protein